MSSKLPRQYYNRPTLTVARALLNQRLVRVFEGERLVGRIVEVEAYIGEDDQASHARFGRTERNAAMYGPPGHAYVYLIYGVHHCLNIVTEEEGYPAAILIRALEPLTGIETQQRLRGEERPFRDLTRGPGRLCQALAIDRSFDGADLCAPDMRRWVESDAPLAPAQIGQGPRIGVTGAQEKPWRFYVRGSPWLSR